MRYVSSSILVAKLASIERISTVLATRSCVGLTPTDPLS